MMKTIALITLVYSVSLALPGAAPQRGEELLPKGTVLYAEVSRGAELLAALVESPARQQVESQPFYRYYQQSENYKKLGLVVKLFETKIGLAWRPTMETLTAGGLWLGLDAGSDGGLAILAKSGDEQVLEGVLKAVVEAARDDAQRNGREAAQLTQYRGIDVYGADKGGFARVGPWLVAANKAELGRAMLDNLLDGPAQSLAQHERFQAARRGYAGQGGWAWADLESLREAGVAEKLFAGQADNPLVEILLGGVLGALKEAPYATAAVRLKEPKRVGLTLAVPRGQAAPAREFFFGADGQGAAEAALSIPGRMLALSAYRDLGSMWLAADELFNETVAGNLAKQDSTLGVFFNGKNFGSDVLGQLHPQLQLLVAEQDYAAGNQPAVKLPAFALLARIQDEAALPRQLRAAFQTIIGFLNIASTQAGRPLLELKTEERDGTSLVSATYVETAPDQAGGDGIHYNFSPALLQRGPWVALCSTRALAEQLAGRLAAPPPSAGVNSQLRLEVGALQRVLVANRGTFVAQQQLKKGLDEAEAGRQVDGLLALLSLFDAAQLTLDGDKTSLSLELDIDFAESLVVRE